MKKIPVQVAIFGDTGYSIKAHIPQSFQDISENETIAVETIEFYHGGCGDLLAKECTTLFEKTYLFSRLGNSPIDISLKKELENEGVIIPLSPSKLPTCLFSIIYDGNGNGHRLMVRNRPNASHDLSVKDIEEHLALLHSSKILFIIGYNLEFNDERRNATLRAIEEVKLKGDTAIIIDITPHNLHNTISLNQLIANGDSSKTIWVSNANTIRRFLNIGDPKEVLNHDTVIKTAKILQGTTQGTWILRYGKDDYEYQVIVSNNSIEPSKTSFIPGITPRAGYGEKNLIDNLSTMIEDGTLQL